MFESLPYFKKTFGAMKSSLGMFGVLYATKMTVALPFILPKFLSEDLTRKFTMIYTNVNATKKPYIFDNKAMIGLYVLAPGNGKIGTCFSILTAGSVMSVACFSDKSQMRDPQQLINTYL